MEEIFTVLRVPRVIWDRDRIGARRLLLLRGLVDAYCAVGFGYIETWLNWSWQDHGGVGEDHDLGIGSFYSNFIIE